MRFVGGKRKSDLDFEGVNLVSWGCVSPVRARMLAVWQIGPCGKTGRVRPKRNTVSVLALILLDFLPVLRITACKTGTPYMRRIKEGGIRGRKSPFTTILLVFECMVVRGGCQIP